MGFVQREPIDIISMADMFMRHQVSTREAEKRARVEGVGRVVGLELAV